MFLHALATAAPPRFVTQANCWELIERSPVRQRLQKRSRLILHSVLRGDHGIAGRHFAIADLDRIFDLTADELNAAFRVEAPRLAEQDLVGLGCGAAIPALRSVTQILAARPDATVACVAVEICSAAFYLDDDPGVLISACLFGDGAAATIWRGTPGPARLRAFDFNTLHRPADRDKLRFEMKDGKLRNLLHRTVPELVAGAVSTLWGQKGPRPVSRVVSHAGGIDVLAALAGAVPGYSLEASAAVLRHYGNMSSPSVLFALEETLRTASPGPDGDFWLVSFGAGFSAHCCRLGCS